MAIVSLSKNTGQVQPNGVKCREFTQLVCSVDLTILVHLTKPIKLHNNGASCPWGHTDNRPVYSNAEEETLLFGGYPRTEKCGVPQPWDVPKLLLLKPPQRSLLLGSLTPVLAFFKDTLLSFIELLATLSDSKRLYENLCPRVSHSARENYIDPLGFLQRKVKRPLPEAAALAWTGDEGQSQSGTSLLMVP